MADCEIDKKDTVSTEIKFEFKFFFFGGGGSYNTTFIDPSGVAGRQLEWTEGDSHTSNK